MISQLVEKFAVGCPSARDSKRERYREIERESKRQRERERERPRERERERETRWSRWIYYMKERQYGER